MGETGQPFEVDVVEVARLTPTIVRVQVVGAAPEPRNAPDEACVLHVPLLGGGHDERGRWYTVRAELSAAGAPSRMTFDLVTHDGGVGAAWARRARVGDKIGISARNSWFRRPADAIWQVLVGDVTGLPAITRIAEEAPSGLRTTVVLEVPDAAEQPAIAADTTWEHNPGLAGGSRLPELVGALRLPAGPGYVYVAGEAAATRAVRKHLRHERRLPPGSYGVIGYWRLDAERWMRRYESKAEAYERAWRRAETAGRDDEEIRDLYEAELAAAGLL